MIAILSIVSNHALNSVYDQSNFTVWFNAPEETNSSIILKFRNHYNKYANLIVGTPIRYIYLALVQVYLL